MTNETLTSPVGKLLFMAVHQPTTNKYSGKAEYGVRMMFDGTTTEGATFRDQLKALNSKLVGPQEPNDAVPKGYYTVNARSDFKPQVMDDEGTEVNTEELPYFAKGSTGEAVITLKTFVGQKGGSVKLTGVVILDLNCVAGEPKENQTKNSLLEAIAKVKRG